MGEIEAVGDAITGALAGRALEPGAGEPGADGHTHERQCLNCGTALVGDYCQSCGQRAHVHRTLSAFFHDLLHGVLHFEGKIWTTLPMLAWRPGELTRRYIEGERAKFVSPMALFLFSVFLMFAVASFSGTVTGTPDSPAVRTQIAANRAEEEAKLARLQRERESALQRRADTAAVDGKIEEQQRELTVIRGIETGELNSASGMRLAGVPDWLRAPAEKAGKNPDLLFYKLKTNAYKFSWLLIPLSVPFLWLMFPFSRRFRLYDHTVFVTYSLSFMTLLTITGVVLAVVGLGPLIALLFLVTPLHMYWQLKDAYGLSRSGAVIRTILLIAFATLALGLFALSLIGLGLFD
jgi:hypothetical protein